MAFCPTQGCENQHQKKVAKAMQAYITDTKDDEAISVSSVDEAISVSSVGVNRRLVLVVLVSIGDYDFCLGLLSRVTV